jgi:hypothetical protein
VTASETTSLITALVTGVGVLVAAWLGVASIRHSTRRQETELKNEQARRIGDWLSRVPKSFAEATSLVSIIDPMQLRDEGISQAVWRILLVQLCDRARVTCASLMSEQVAILSTSAEINDQSVKNAVIAVSNALATTRDLLLKNRDAFIDSTAWEGVINALRDLVKDLSASDELLQSRIDTAAASLESTLSRNGR